MLTNETTQLAAEHVAADATEREAAVALLTAAVALARPSLRLALRLAPDGEIILGGPGELHHAKGQYATTGRVSGWAWVLLATGEVARREYSGSHSDFPDYHRVARSDRRATVADVIDHSGYRNTFEARARDAVQAIAEAVARVADERKIAEAKSRAERLRRAAASFA